MRFQTLAFALITALPVSLASCSHAPPVSQDCDWRRLSELNFKTLNGGYFYSPSVKRAPANSLWGSWTLVGEYSRDLDGLDRDAYDPDGEEHPAYGRLELTPGRHDVSDAKVILSSTSDVFAKKTDTYDLKVLGNFADSIQTGSPNDPKIEQPLRVLDQCDAILIQWHSTDRRLHYLLYRRGPRASPEQRDLRRYP